MADAPTSVLYLTSQADLSSGAQVGLLQLVTRLDRAKWAPQVVVPAEGPFSEQCHCAGIPTHVLPLPNRWWWRRDGRAVVQRLRALIRATRATVLHANGALAMRFAGWAARREGCSAVWHVRTTDVPHWTDRVLARLATRIVVNAQLVARRFPQVSTNKLLCIYTGVDLDAYPESSYAKADAVRRRLGVPLNVPMVLSMGPFRREQGFAQFFEAIERLAVECPDVHWVMVGEGDERAALERRAQEFGLSDRLHFPGWVTDVADTLAACDVFVLPSLQEGLGRVLIEAMTMRKPVVASCTGGVPEVVVPGETGVLVPPGDSAALAQAIRNMVANPDLAVYFGTKGRERVEAQFTVTRHVEAVSHVYETLVA
ncbi:MAG: glycosyltransferase family 4 protein [Nitrospiraceae bacterium]